MVKKQQSKRQRNIKSKLMAAICMLLVSTIMMVSSTYAWFTLSTAPEVTGITTAVGANGNLEMALVPTGGPTTVIKSEAGDSTKTIEDRNITWGNLVDLSDTTVYGLDKITLFPAALNLDAAGKLTTTAMLKTPTYGADGRVDQLVANTVTSYYNSTDGFVENSDYGVRAVGTASGMTDRQLDYRNARSASNTAMSQAKNAASSSLNSRGSSLANVAIKKGMDSAGTATYTEADVAALQGIVDDLLSDTGALKYIDTAYRQAILAYAASAKNTVGDGAWLAVKGTVETAGATISTVKDALEANNIPMPAELSTAIGKYETTLKNVNDANTELGKLSGTSFTWAQLSPIMTLLADTDGMTINGFKASEIKASLGALVSSVTSMGGVTVTMATGGGVYADIADQCGDYTASIVIEKVEYNGLVLENMNARMATKGQTPAYLAAIATVLNEAGSPASGSGEKVAVSDMYGYVIDLAFRTNATDSSLKLQIDAADRIYSDNTHDETMGHGSSMTFASTTTGFSNDNVKELMKAIRLVFFDPSDGTVFVNGKLDVEHATVGADGVTAEMYLYTGSAENANAVNYIKVTDGSGTHKLVEEYRLIGDDADYTGTKYSQSTGDDGKPVYTPATDGTYGWYQEYVEMTPTEKESYTGDQYKAVTGEVKKTDDIIMPLTQNTQTAMSVLVYLDGNNMGNDDVAATAATSMTGKMNIQFASTATLVPMEYASLHIPEGGGSGNNNQATTYTVSATPAGGVTNLVASATKGTDYSFTVADGYSLTGVTIGGTAYSDYTNSGSTYTIPGAAVTGNIAITVTAD